MPFAWASGFADELLEQEQTQSALLLAADATARVAASIAPVASGYYAAHFVAGIDPDGRVLLGNTDFAAAVIEFGSSNNPAFATLRRAVVAAGYRLAESD